MILFKWLLSLTWISITISKKSVFLFVKCILEIFPLFLAIALVTFPKLPALFVKIILILEVNNWELLEGQSWLAFEFKWRWVYL